MANNNKKGKKGKNNKTYISEKGVNPALKGISEKLKANEVVADANEGALDSTENNQTTIENVPETKKIIIPDEELTSADKEALIEEGRREKKRLIEEAEKEAKEKATEIIESATLKRDEILAEYKIEVKAQALEEFDAEKAKILLDLAEKEKQIKQEIASITMRTEAVTKMDKELSEKWEKFIKESAEFSVKRDSYKTQVIEEVNEMFAAIEKEKSQLSKQVESLKEELRKNKKLLEAITEDKNIYEADSQDYSERLAEITKLKLSNERLINDRNAISEALTEAREENRNKELLLKRFGENPDALIVENAKLENENKELRTAIKDCPSQEELMLLRNKANILSQKETKIRELEIELSKCLDELREVENFKDDIENYKRYIRVLELQKRELQRELDRIIDTYNNNSSKVFVTLSNIDKLPIPASHSIQNVSLKDVCDNFRIYAASRKNNPLKYSEQHIRTFVAGFAASRLFILEGLSGTGKSKLPEVFAEYLNCVVSSIPVQSAWKDRNDLLGFYNDFEKRYKETDFLVELYKATRDSDNIHIIVLDEMNLSRIEYYFADFLSKLEKENPDDWKINLISDNVRGEMPQYIIDGNIPILTNTWFVGTANKDDSTFMITDKVYDRAIVLEFNERDEGPKITKPVGILHLSNTEFQKLITNAIQKCSSPEKLSELINDLDDTMMKKFKITFGYRMDKQIRNFVAAYEACGGKMLEAVDILFASKVLRKLQGFYDEGTKKNLMNLWEELEKKYPKDEDFCNSKEVISEMIEKLG